MFVKYVAIITSLILNIGNAANNIDGNAAAPTSSATPAKTRTLLNTPGSSEVMSGHVFSYLHPEDLAQLRAANRAAKYLVKGAAGFLVKEFATLILAGKQINNGLQYNFSNSD